MEESGSPGKSGKGGNDRSEWDDGRKRVSGEVRSANKVEATREGRNCQTPKRGPRPTAMWARRTRRVERLPGGAARRSRKGDREMAASKSLGDGQMPMPMRMAAEAGATATANRPGQARDTEARANARAGSEGGWVPGGRGRSPMVVLPRMSLGGCDSRQTSKQEICRLQRGRNLEGGAGRATNRGRRRAMMVRGRACRCYMNLPLQDRTLRQGCGGQTARAGGRGEKA